MITPEQLKKELNQCTGTENYYKHWTGTRYTDGIKTLAEAAQAHWLIDAITSHQQTHANRTFQVWTLHVKNNKATLTMREDTELPTLVTQKIPTTDFPTGEWKLYLINNILLLPQEY